MCGIFGFISTNNVNKHDLNLIAKHAQQRGMDSSGLIYLEDTRYVIRRADYRINMLIKNVKPYSSNIVLGHSRLVTNGLLDNQPVVKDKICAIHNGIIVNEDHAWDQIQSNRSMTIDSELIVAITQEYLSDGGMLYDVPRKILSICRGVISCAIILPHLGKILLFSNNGSLYVGSSRGGKVFASEKYGLELIGCVDICQVKADGLIIDINKTDDDFEILDVTERVEDLIPKFCNSSFEESKLQFKAHDFIRCTKCILPETMPFINFDASGVCNYCRSYRIRNMPKPIDELFHLVERYRKPGKDHDCVVPFSGGRDSSYGLHLIKEELGMKPITYTYDWGMVTDLGRRNISQMCGDMGIENIIVAANISQKRRNIRLNLHAWLKSPHLGMLALLTAGDKHFFRHVESVKKQTGINLNLWGVNPLETTHFKTGFLGIGPDFEEAKVYSSGAFKQAKYHTKRFGAMLQSPGYFNSSLWDTLSGEYYRSFTKKKDYFHIFDYYRWDENEVNSCLIDKYGWETALDTSTTWRIGDGTAGFYNYIYYTVAGFTEHDTFRSNQIREGQLTRENALSLVKDENQPRYQNIRWYLDAVGLDYGDTIKIVNSIPKIYREI